MVDKTLSAVLDDIPLVLGAPFLNLIFRRLSQWPELLTDLWVATRPVVLTVEFAEAATTLAYLAAPIDAAPRIERPPSMSAEEWVRALLLTRAYRAVQPQLLLIVAGWAMPTSGDADMPSPAAPVELTSRPIPRRGDSRADVAMISAEPKDLKVAALFEQMIVQRGHPGVASYYRSLAQWPPLLQLVWGRLQPIVSTAAYALQVQRLIATAVALASELHIHRMQNLARVGTAGTASDVLQVWRDVQIPQLMIDTALVETALSDSQIV